MIDVDSHNFANLPLMKLSSYHKSIGDIVEMVMPICKYDKVYVSKVFTFTLDIDYEPQADEIVYGGTGYGLENKLPDEIEHIYPDYSLYSEMTKETAYGFLTRGCPRNCKFCIVTQKEGCQSIQVAELGEFWRGQKFITLLDPNLLACINREKILQELIDSKAYINFSQGLDIRLTDKYIAEMLKNIKTKIFHFAWDNPNENLYGQFGDYGKRGCWATGTSWQGSISTNLTVRYIQSSHLIFRRIGNGTGQ